MAAWDRRAADAKGEPMPVVRVGEPGSEVLRTKARPVKNINRGVRGLVERMWATMYREHGAGLAAPQVGVSQRVLVVDVGDHWCALVNPEIVDSRGSQLEPLEGCLSIPDLTGEVERAQFISVHAQDPDGHEVWIDAEGFFARALQHEVDHLNGVLFTDRARRLVPVAPETKLRVVFLGSSAFGVTVLQALLAKDVQPVAVITRPDRPAGRGLELHPTPVRRAAEDADLEVWTPERSRDPELRRRVAELEPDVLLTAAYGQIVPDSLLSLPKLAALNVHPSLLPLYRGPDPIRRTLWDGAAQTGVTIQRMVAEVDAGDILLQEATHVGPDEDAGALGARLAELGGQLTLRALRLLASGKAAWRTQDHAKATHAPKISPEEEVAGLTLPAPVLANRVRALAPHPGLRLPGGLKILAAAVAADAPAGEPGLVLAVEQRGLVVATGQGALLVREVQPAGGRRMPADAYARGRRLVAGMPLV